MLAWLWCESAPIPRSSLCSFPDAENCTLQKLKWFRKIDSFRALYFLLLWKGSFGFVLERAWVHIVSLLRSYWLSLVSCRVLFVFLYRRLCASTPGQDCRVRSEWKKFHTVQCFRLSDLFGESKECTILWRGLLLLVCNFWTRNLDPSYGVDGLKGGVAASWTWTPGE